MRKIRISSSTQPEKGVYELLKNFPGENDFNPQKNQEGIEKCTKEYQGNSSPYGHIISVYRQSDPENPEIIKLCLVTFYSNINSFKIYTEFNKKNNEIDIYSAIPLLDSMQSIIEKHGDNLNNISIIKNEQEKLKQEIQQEYGNFQIVSKELENEILYFSVGDTSEKLPSKYLELITPIHSEAVPRTISDQQIKLLRSQLRIYDSIY